jgi:hypothetical protein
MTLIGAVVGYNGIPGHFKERIINSKMCNSPRPRAEKYCPQGVIKIIQSFQRIQQRKYIKAD